MSEITDKLRHLVSLDKPESGGPYGGYAAAQCVKAMAEAADYIDRLEAALKPFAEVAAAMSDNPKPDDWIAWGYNSADILYGDFRAARRALTPCSRNT